MEREEELKGLLSENLNGELERIIFSNPRSREHFIKLTVRPLLLRGGLRFQIEEFTEKQAFQKNLDADAACSYLMEQLEALYRSGEILSRNGMANILIGKKGTVTIKRKRKMAPPVSGGNGGTGAARPGGGAAAARSGGGAAAGVGLPGENAGGSAPVSGISAPDIPALNLPAHNRTKKYLLPEGTPVPFLVDLGVMTAEGRVVKARYDKFRQINRFLEFIEDILPKLDKSRTNTIIDFGCGKSYLTFAMYYYLKELKGYSIQVIGLDLKKDVIALCSRLSEKFGFENLHFLHGDIAGYEGVDQVDMVVTLHACDTATDFAMAKAVRWGAKVILSVPCCQHELNRQVKNELLAPVLQYGLIKERMAALLTDGIRGQLLEQAGYRCQILEFIDMEHTPKNIMIRAVYQGKRMDGGKLTQMMEELQVQPTLFELLKKDGLI